MLKKLQQPSMTPKRSHHLITLQMLIGVPIQKRLSLQYNVIDLMVDLKLKMLKNGATHLRDNGDGSIAMKTFHSTIFF